MKPLDLQGNVVSQQRTNDRPGLSAHGSHRKASQAHAQQRVMQRQGALDRADAELKAARATYRRLHGGRNPQAGLVALLAELYGE